MSKMRILAENGLLTQLIAKIGDVPLGFVVDEQASRLLADNESAEERASRGEAEAMILVCYRENEGKLVQVV